MNTVPAAAATWDLKGHMLKVSDISKFKIPATIDIKALTWNCTWLGEECVLSTVINKYP